MYLLTNRYLSDIGQRSSAVRDQSDFSRPLHCSRVVSSRSEPQMTPRLSLRPAARRRPHDTLISATHGTCARHSGFTHDTPPPTHPHGPHTQRTTMLSPNGTRFIQAPMVNPSSRHDPYTDNNSYTEPFTKRYHALQWQSGWPTASEEYCDESVD